MSRSWRSEIRLAIHTDRIAALKLSGSWRRRVQAHAVWPCSPPENAESWRPALETLRANISSLGHASRASVVLSNRCVHYAYLRLKGELNERERTNYIQHKLKGIFGDIASNWTVRATEPDLDGGVMVAGIDRELIEGVKRALGPLAAAASIRPHFSAAYDRVRRDIAVESAWFVVQEHKHVVVAHLNGGRWRSLAGRHVGDSAADALFAVLDREHALQNIPHFCETVCVVPSQSLPASHFPSQTRYKVKTLTPLRPDGFPINKERDYALAA